jgi:hypothetical protein
MKERIKQFSIWFFENEDHKEVEHVRRRLERKRKRKLLAKKRGARPIRWLYVLDVILWIAGIAITLCSSIKAFGENTEFYKRKELYRPLGPCVLAAAALFLFLATGLKHRMQIKHNKPPQRAFYIVQKNNKNSETDPDIKDPDNDSGNEEDIEMTVLGLKSESYLETAKEIGAKKEIETNRADDTERLKASMPSSEWPKVAFYQEDERYTRRDQSRKAWAKTKWMRVESYDHDDVLDLTEDVLIGGKKHGQGETRESHAELPVRYTNISENRRITRFKPRPGGCFTAQSSIKSQTSEISFASTTSESAPLVRK